MLKFGVGSLLFTLSLVAFLAGLAFLKAAESAIHEIEAFLLLLISSVLLSGGVITETIIRSLKKIAPLIPSEQTEAPKEKLLAPGPPVSPKFGLPNSTSISRSYYYSVMGKQAGPIGFTEMRQLVQSGAIPKDAIVFAEGDSQWRPVLGVSELAVR